MQISLTNTGKRFNREWIFRNFCNEFALHPKKYAITGANGSGKSTLLQVIAGSLTFSEGTISFSNDEQQITNNGQQQTSNEQRETNKRATL